MRGLKNLRGHFNSDGRAKKSYPTREAALAFLVKHYPRHSPYGVYQCPDYRHWHIGRGGA